MEMIQRTEGTATYVERGYCSVTDTAKMIRQVLKEAFPGVKFGVKCHKYAGGSSIDIDWTDGPNEKQVKAFIEVFEGSYFDGMIDYKGSKYAKLDGKPMHFGGDFIFYRRRYTDQAVERVIDALWLRFGVKEPKVSIADYHTGEAWRVFVVGNHQGNQNWTAQTHGKSYPCRLRVGTALSRQGNLRGPRRNHPRIP